MKPFEYAAPADVKDVTSLLADTWGDTEIYAGGTDLVTCLKQGLTEPKRVVSLRNISGLKGIVVDGDTLRIAAMTTLLDLAKNADVKEHFPALVQAARGVGSTQMIAVGTIGGDLCQRPRCWYYRNGHGLFGMENGQELIPGGENRYHAIFGNSGKAKFVSPSSLGPALIALDATIAIVGPDGPREVPAASFFRTPESESERETVLAPNEIVTAVVLPLAGLKNATYEVRHRHGLDWPYATASVAYKLDGGKASDVRVVLGHVAPTPWPSAAAASALQGAEVTAESAASCGAAATEGATPLSQNGYKLRLVKVAVKRAVLEAAGIKMEA
jgi:xanthine dehydrogenase YagS FAD-binding subunit